MKTTGTAFAAAGLMSGTATAEASEGLGGEYHVNGWYPAWGVWSDYHPRDIPFDLLDFVSVSDFTPEPNGTVAFTYPSIESDVLGEFGQVDRDGTRVIMLIGAAGGSGEFAESVSTAGRRDRFADTIIDYLRTYDLDGADIDWEFPLIQGGSDAENDERRRNFMSLLELLRSRFDEAGDLDGKYYWLTASLSPQPWRAREHDTQRMGELLDFAAIMNYNFAGDWSNVTQHDAPLFSENDGGSPDFPPSSHVAVRAWIEEGIPPEKVNFGIPAFGSVFNGVSDGGTNGLGQSWSSWEGMVSYAEIIEQYANNSAYDRLWDSTAEVPWIYSSSEGRFVSYDDTESVERKCEYVAEHGLHGVMFWETMLDTADHALLRAADGGREERSVDDPPIDEGDEDPAEGDEDEEDVGEDDDDEEGDEDEGEVSLVTDGVSDVGESTATLRVTIESMGEVESAHLWAAYAQTDSDSWPESSAGGYEVTSAGEYEIDLDGMQPGTEYVVQSELWDSSGSTAHDIASRLTFATEDEEESDETPDEDPEEESDEEPEGDDHDESEPEVDRFELSDRSNPQWARSRVRWAVSEPDGALETVTLALIRSAGGTVVDSKTLSVGGSGASGTHDLRNRRDHGEYEVSLRVATSDGESESVRREIDLSS